MISVATHEQSCTAAFGLGDTVCIELRNHDAADLRCIRGQLALPRHDREVPPDLVLRFEDRLRPDSLKYVDQAHAYSDDGFYVVAGRSGDKICVRMPVESLGMNCELICQRGLSAVPLLKQIVDLTALGKGVLPVHASSFVFQGQAALMSGAAHSAKTTTLLGFVSRGAQYIGDETAYVDHDGRVFSDDSAVCLSDRHLADLPSGKRLVPYRKRLHWRVARLANSLVRGVPGYDVGRGRLRRGLRKLDRALAGCRTKSVPPAMLFSPAERCASHELHKAFLSVAHDAPEVTVEAVSRDAFVQRLVQVMLFEFAPLVELYNKFRFAFPSRTNALLERLPWHLEQVAHERLEGQSLYMVYHPYPVSAQMMWDAMSPLF